MLSYLKRIAIVALAAFSLAQGLETRAAVEPNGKRQTIELDGIWKIQRGGTELPQTPYTGTVPVPGLTDQAKDVPGMGEFWWYQREFTVDTAPTVVAYLKFHKSMYGTQVFLNGKQVGEYWPSFSPFFIDVKSALNFHGPNTLTVRIGERKNLPKEVCDGNDFEKRVYTPGIYDSVRLILSQSPKINTVQTNPRLDGTVEIKVGLANVSGVAYDGKVAFTVRRVDNSEVVATGTAKVAIPAAGSADVTTTLSLRECQYWSPEKPFLYTLTTQTAGDERTDRFGMRTFRFDPKTGWPELNGRRYNMLGTNITIFRFFENSNHGGLAWNREWVRQLIRKYKTMNWNSVRMCIGFPPDFWYDICDEEGFLVQDEFPIWYSGGGKKGEEKVPEKITPQQIAAEATPWIYERCNHPCVFLWDLSNETTSEKTKEALSLIRHIDIQGRRWENGTEGYNDPVSAEDPVEHHPYPFSYAQQTLGGFNSPPKPRNIPNPYIVNEYGWLWLNRDGSPCKLTFRNYEFLVGGGLGSGDYGTEADRRYIYNTYMAANTEFLRSSRQVNILHQFCALGYSRPNPAMPWKSGETSDNFLEPASEQKFDPYFENYMKDAFAPIGVCIERYDATYPAGSKQDIPVAIYNDTATPWEGEVRLRVVAGGPTISKKDAQIIVPGTTAQLTLPPFTKILQKLQIQVPQVTGDYTLVAEYGAPAERVQSIRDFVVGKKPRWIRDLGPNLAKGQPAKVSAVAKNPANDEIKAIDGDWKTNWNLPDEKAWIQVDLGAVISVGSLRLFWANPETRSVHHHATSYKIAVSADERTWKEVVSITDGDGYRSYHDLGGIPCRFVRVESIKAALPKEGIKLHELEIYAPEALKHLFMGNNVPGSEVYNWRKARAGLAVGKPAKASSSHPGAGAPQAAFDGDSNTRWSSMSSDPQWIAVDLEKAETISRVELDWEKAYGKAYSIEVSADGETWREVYKTENGKGSMETITFAPVEARWIRLYGMQRATNYGYSLWEMRVFAK